MKNRKRQSSRRPLGMLSAEVQALETRCLPAGTVTFVIDGGNLKLTGDNKNNVIEVDLTSTGDPTSTGIFVRGLDGTNIKFGARTTTDGSPVQMATSPRVVKDLAINLKDGDDEVSIYIGGSVAATIGRNLKIDTGRGLDTVEIDVQDGSLTIGNMLDIKLGDDSDYLLLDAETKESDLPEDLEEFDTAPLHVAGLAKISGGAGDDIVGVVGFSTDGNLQIETGGGDDTVGIADALIGGNLVLSTGADDDDVGIEYSAVLGRTAITTGSGDDRVGIINAYSEGNVTILLQQGNDTLAAAKKLSIGEDALVTLNGGSGRSDEIDNLVVESESVASLAGRATVRSFEDIDPPAEEGDDEAVTFDILEDVFFAIFFEFDV